MISLAIDTSAHLCAVAVHDGARGAILAEMSEEIGRGHAERLMDVIRATLDKAGRDYSDIGRVVVTTGPGSFTGIRVGLATARGIALGLGIDAVGVSTLEAAGEHCAAAAGWDRRAPLLVALDARRGEAYCLFMGGRNGDLPAEPFVAPYHRIAELVVMAGPLALCGSGARHVNSAAGTDYPVLHELAVAPISTVARIGAERGPGERPEPLYIRPPDAKPQEGFAVRRA